MQQVRVKEAKVSAKVLHQPNKKKADKWLRSRPVPVVLGPGGPSSQQPQSYLIGRHYVWPYSSDGTPLSLQEFVAHLPSDVRGLKDDPYRSLAALVRGEGGYEKVWVPFSEFRWANWLRSAVPLKEGEDPAQTHVVQAARDWAEYLPLVEFAINNAWQESVRSTPFYLNYGYHPRLAELLDLPQKVPQAHDFVKGMKTAVEQARQCLARAQKRMKSYQDNKRREVLYLPGDMVLLSTQNMRGKANQPGVRKLKPRYVGPFNVQYMVGKAAVKLWLPDEWSRLHNVFHVSLVKPYRTDASEAVPGLAGPPPVQWLDGEPQYTVEKVVGHRLEPSKGKRKGKSKKRRLEFLVKWHGHGDEHNTWELSTQLVGCQELMARYMAEHNLGAEAEEAADGEAEAQDDVEAKAQA
ncbi:hypothetical protein QJQ45_009976 [Haematococcus lacustris]|nr:hypothetical protein QJQ45_009976 [Haematococcus lacustris]